jgi:hypothetical protein
MTGDQHSAPYFVILDVAIRDVERYLTYPGSTGALGRSSVP